MNSLAEGNGSQAGGGFLRHFNRNEFISFFICGCAATAINITARGLLSHSMPYGAAIAVAYCIGLVAAFWLFRRFTFNKVNKTGQSPKKVACYLAVNFYGLLQTMVISVVLADYFFPWVGMDFYPQYIAHFLGLCPLVLTSYLGHKYLTFRR